MYGVIFDFNGTLIDDGRFHIIAWDNIAYNNFGIHLTVKDLATTFNGKPNKETIKILSNNTISDSENDRLSDLKEEAYRKALKESGTKLRPGAIELFNILKAKDIPFTIASASVKANIDFFIELFELDKWIDPSKIIYDDGTYDNKLKMFIDAKKVLGNPDKTIIFEDSLSGLKYAQEVGDIIYAIEDEELTPYYKDFSKLKRHTPDFRDVLEDFNTLDPS